MRLIASQFLLLSVALAVSGQSFNCWYLRCDDYATGSLQQSVGANGQINQNQPSQSSIVQKVESSQFKPQIQNYVISQVAAPIATQDVAKVETSQQYIYLPQNFVSSQPEKTLNVQPSQSQYTIFSQQPVERPVAPKIETSYQYAVPQKYVVNQLETIVEKQPAQSQYMAWTQEPVKNTVVPQVESQFVSLPQKFVATQQQTALNVQPSQSQYTIFSQKPIAPKVETSYQYVTLPEKFVASNPETTVNKQPAQSQFTAWTQQPIQRPVAPKLETTYQYFSLPQTVVTSQAETSTINKQPAQSQFTAWTQEPVKSTVAPKVETSYQYVTLPEKFIASNPETTVNKQPAQSQFTAWTQQSIQRPVAPKLETTYQYSLPQTVATSQTQTATANKQPTQTQYSAWSVQAPEVSTYQYISPSQNTPTIQFATLNDQQIQYPTWIINQQPIQSQEAPKTDSAQQYYINSQSTLQSQNGAWMANPQSTQNLESTHQYISLPQSLIANSETSQSPISTMTVNQQPSVAGNIDYFYQQPNRFLVNFVSYPIQETSQSQLSANVGPKPLQSTTTLNANLPKIEETAAKPVAVSPVNVNTVKPGEIVANSANIINQKTETVVTAEAEKKPNLIIAEESKVQANKLESQQTGAPLNEKTESLNAVPAEKPVESQDTPQVNSESVTPANQE